MVMTILNEMILSYKLNSTEYSPFYFFEFYVNESFYLFKYI